MDMLDLFRALGSLGIVIALIALILLGVRKSGIALPGVRRNANTEPRLSLEDVLPIDQRRKLILVRRDEVAHLILIGTNTELVIESGIPLDQAKKRADALTRSNA